MLFDNKNIQVPLFRQYKICIIRYAGTLCSGQFSEKLSNILFEKLCFHTFLVLQVAETYHQILLNGKIPKNMYIFLHKYVFINKPKSLHSRKKNKVST